MLELEHYKADNDRLIKLLGDKNKYFSDFAKDNKGSVRYLAGPVKYGKSECDEPEDNSWIPHEAFEIAHQFRDSNGNALSETMINKMLRELNKVWRDRERRQIARVKNSCSTELKDLRRQMTMRAPVSENKLQKEVQRLKDQLKEAKRDLRNNVAKRHDDKRGLQVDHVQEALSTAGKYQDERRNMWEENKMLKQKVSDLNGIVQNEDADRSKFMDGASWMARKAIVENEATQQKLNELTNAYNQLKRDYEVNGKGLFSQKNGEELATSIKDALECSKRNLQGMLATTTYNHTVSDRNVKHATREY